MSLLDCTRVTANVGGKEIILETGRIARQAAGAVWIQCEGAVCLTTVCETPLDTPRDFFPLTVEYAEKMYAAGRIPGNFFRREIGRPSDNETLISRLIDRFFISSRVIYFSPFLLVCPYYNILILVCQKVTPMKYRF